MISQHIYARVFHIRCGGKQGTAFLGNHDGKEYFVTAEHLIEHVSDDVRIEVEFKDAWHEWPLTLLGRGSTINKNYDIAVFQSRADPALSNPLPLDGSEAIVSDDAYFLGYPYGMVSHRRMLGGWPVALVKKALFSGFDEDNRLWVLDGHNNVGFSGGPVLVRKNGRGPLEVGAVIAAYRKEYAPVMDCRNWFRDTNLLAESNSGIIFATSIAVAKTIIETI